MYRLLIVDDEPWVLRSLVDSVDWTEKGFEIAGTATDGEEALAFMEQQLPDLVVTDIRMPVMDGLELISKALHRWPRIRFIILSGHAEFEYAKRALESGVAGYCLKPVQLEEISACLLRVKSELEEETLRQLEELLAQEDETNEKEMEGLLQRIGFKWSNQEVIRVVAGPCRTGYPLLRTEQLFLLGESQLAEFLEEETEGSHIGCSGRVHSAGFLGRAVAEAREARLYWFLEGNRGIHVYRAKGRVSLHRQFQALSKFLSDCDVNGIRHILAQIEQVLQEGNVGLRQVEACQLRLEAFLETERAEYCEDEGTEVDPGLALTEAYDSLHAMILAYGDLYVKNCSTDASIVEGTGGETVPALMQYIESHATERISLMELSELFHFSPGYLCRLIKRETGRTLTEHQSRLRLDMATNLLCTTNLAVADIAQRCGYQDYFYFARLFRKTFGTTPSAVRNRS